MNERDPNEEADYIHKIDRHIFRWVAYALIACSALAGMFLAVRSIIQ